MKDIIWLADAREAAARFPKGAKLKLGKELTRLQLGSQPINFDWLPEVGRGVQEIRIAHNRDAYRVIYVATLGDAVYVLHAFQKKSKKGVSTPREDVLKAKERYGALKKALQG